MVQVSSQIVNSRNDPWEYVFIEASIDDFIEEESNRYSSHGYRGIEYRAEQPPRTVIEAKILACFSEIRRLKETIAQLTGLL